jgi:plasmid stabilization system protein ParE
MSLSNPKIRRYCRMSPPRPHGSGSVSKRGKIHFAESFFVDLEDIFDYIAGNFGKRLVGNIIADIHREITELLGANPKLGRVYPDDEFYHYIFVSKRKDIVFYHAHDDGAITVYRIFDQRRDYGKLLQ